MGGGVRENYTPGCRGFSIRKMSRFFYFAIFFPSRRPVVYVSVWFYYPSPFRFEERGLGLRADETVVVGNANLYPIIIIIKAYSVRYEVLGFPFLHRFQTQWILSTINYRRRWHNNNNIIDTKWKYFPVEFLGAPQYERIITINNNIIIEIGGKAFAVFVLESRRR